MVPFFDHLSQPDERQLNVMPDSHQSISKKRLTQLAAP